MKNQDIYELMDRFEACGIARLKLSTGDTTLELEKAIPAAAASVAVAAAPAATFAAPATPVAPAAPASAQVPAESQPQAADAPATPASDLPCITAPLVGTFYIASEPGKAPYVQPGDKVKKGDTVALLEAMKMMSEVPAPCDCVIEEIVAADGELVSFGAPLIRYREA